MALPPAKRTAPGTRVGECYWLLNLVSDQSSRFGGMDRGMLLNVMCEQYLRERFECMRCQNLTSDLAYYKDGGAGDPVYVCKVCCAEQMRLCEYLDWKSIKHGHVKGGADRPTLNQWLSQSRSTAAQFAHARIAMNRLNDSSLSSVCDIKSYIRRVGICDGFYTSSATRAERKPPDGPIKQPD
jgi:hypothetical protein